MCLAGLRSFKPAGSLMKEGRGDRVIFGLEGLVEHLCPLPRLDPGVTLEFTTLQPSKQGMVVPGLAGFPKAFVALVI